MVFLSINFLSPEKLKKYIYYRRLWDNTGTGYYASLAHWKIQGSNDDSAWDDIHDLSTSTDGIPPYEMNGNYPRYIGTNEKLNNNKNNKYQYFRVVGIKKIGNTTAGDNPVYQVINDVNHSTWNFELFTELDDNSPKINFNRKSLGYTKNKLTHDIITDRISDFNHLTFDGSADTTYITTIPPLKNREFTFTTWFNPSSITNGDKFFNSRGSNGVKSFVLKINDVSDSIKKKNNI